MSTSRADDSNDCFTSFNDLKGMPLSKDSFPTEASMRGNLCQQLTAPKDTASSQSLGRLIFDDGTRLNTFRPTEDPEVHTLLYSLIDEARRSVQGIRRFTLDRAGRDTFDPNEPLFTPGPSFDPGTILATGSFEDTKYNQFSGVSSTLNVPSRNTPTEAYSGSTVYLNVNSNATGKRKLQNMVTVTIQPKQYFHNYIWKGSYTIAVDENTAFATVRSLGQHTPNASP